MNDDCNSDCIYKDTDIDDTTDSIDKKLSHQLNNNNTTTTITSIDEKKMMMKKKSEGEFLSRRIVTQDDDEDEEEEDDDETNVIDKTELDLNKTLQFPCELEEIDADNIMPTNNVANLNKNCNFESICLTNSKENNINVLNNCGEFNKNDDSDTECTDPSESKSENTVCDILIDNKKDVLKSVETSTETLVSESIKCRYAIYLFTSLLICKIFEICIIFAALRQMI